MGVVRFHGSLVYGDISQCQYASIWEGGVVGWGMGAGGFRKEGITLCT